MEEVSAATLLKYRFGEFEHMNKHLHVVQGRTLFFYRDPRSALEADARVVVEFSFGTSDQVATLRGAVIGRAEEGSKPGLWIEFPDDRLAQKVESGAASLTARRQRRMGCDLLVELKGGRMPYLGRMVDLSLGGASVVGAGALKPGSEIEMRIVGAKPPMPGELGRSEVVRADVGGVGLRFNRRDSAARIASGKLYAAVQLAWASAVEVAHSPLCCKDGALLEPPLPERRKKL